MPFTQPVVPDINGIRYGFSSVECSIPGVLPGFLLVALQEISYDDNLEPGELRGTAPQVLGRSRGKYEVTTANITLPLLETRMLITQLANLGAPAGKGYREVSFTVAISYGDIGQPVITDRMVACRIKKLGIGMKNGADEIVVQKIDLSCLEIDWGGNLSNAGLAPYSPLNKFFAL